MRIFIFLFFILTGCFPEPSSTSKKSSNEEKITRKANERFLILTLPKKRKWPSYSWEKNFIGPIPPITKEYFRCKGCSLNPPYPHLQNGEKVPLVDCGGATKHSLPLKNGKEFIYPILIELLNHVQSKTGKRVVITSGHRCPQHNMYIDPSHHNLYSKHQIGAEVSFYVIGYENDPHAIVKILLDYYSEPKYKEKKGFEFQRYEKNDTDVSVKPWFNKEIFIKLYNKQEGRNLDNNHSYPYISIQVRFDIEANERVSYSWDKAYKNYLRK